MGLLLEEFCILDGTVATITSKLAIMNQCQIEGIAFVCIWVCCLQVRWDEWLCSAFISNCDDPVCGELFALLFDMLTFERECSDFTAFHCCCCEITQSKIML